MTFSYIKTNRRFRLHKNIAKHNACSLLDVQLSETSVLFIIYIMTSHQGVKV